MSGTILCLVLCLACVLCPAQGSADPDFPSQELLDATELVTKSDAVLQGFQEDPNMQLFRKNIGTARGIFIAPRMLRGEFLIGNLSGAGVFFARPPVREQWSYPAFYSIDSVSMGLQIGADASEIILLVMTTRGMEALLRPAFRIDSGLVVSAGPVGAGTPRDPADIFAYARSMTGIISGVFLAGSVITPRPALNNAYYGRPVTPKDILLRQVVKNYQAEFLRLRIETGGGKPSTLRRSF